MLIEIATSGIYLVAQELKHGFTETDYMLCVIIASLNGLAADKIEALLLDCPIYLLFVYDVCNNIYYLSFQSSCQSPWPNEGENLLALGTRRGKERVSCV